MTSTVKINQDGSVEGSVAEDVAKAWLAIHKGIKSLSDVPAVVAPPPTPPVVKEATTSLQPGRKVIRSKQACELFMKSGRYSNFESATATFYNSLKTKNNTITILGGGMYYEDEVKALLASKGKA